MALLALLAAALAAATVAGLRLQDPDSATPAEDAGAEPAPAAAASAELTATAQLARMMHEPRTVRVLVTNHGAEPVRVREVELVTESFAATGPVDKDVGIPAGGARALAVIYGEGRCGGEAAPEPAPAVARLVLAQPPSTVEVALPHPDEELALLLARECAAQLVAATVDVRFEAWSQAPDGVLWGSLVVERRGGDEPVGVYDVYGNVLFRVVADQSEPVTPIGTLPPGEDRLEIPVVADVNRCDGHAVGEAKQRFLFRAWISVGGEENLPVTVEVDEAYHDLLKQMLSVRCAD